MGAFKLKLKLKLASALALASLKLAGAQAPEHICVAVNPGLEVFDYDGTYVTSIAQSDWDPPEPLNTIHIINQVTQDGANLYLTNNGEGGGKVFKITDFGGANAKTEYLGLLGVDHHSYLWLDTGNDYFVLSGADPSNEIHLRHHTLSTGLEIRRRTLDHSASGTGFSQVHNSRVITTSGEERLYFASGHGNCGIGICGGIFYIPWLGSGFSSGAPIRVFSSTYQKTFDYDPATEYAPRTCTPVSIV
jgi:hypothetical protein